MMNHSKIVNILKDKLSILTLTLVIVCHLTATKAFAQDEKVAVIKLSFDQNDSMRICKGTVTTDNTPVVGTEVHFYVQRMYSLLPIGKAIETDENGDAIAEFPLDLPGDKNGNIIVVAKIEDDETYGNVENQTEVKWGVLVNEENDVWSSRSLSASRDKAPMVLILVSNTIIGAIWITIFYVIYQIVRIRKESRIIKNKKK